MTRAKRWIVIPLVLVGAVAFSIAAIIPPGSAPDDAGALPGVQSAQEKIPPEVLAARAYVEEKVSTPVDIPAGASEYVQAAAGAVEHYRAAALSPFPYELTTPSGGGEPGLLYRDDSQSTLAVGESELVFNAQRDRTELYRIAVQELQLRLKLGGVSAHSEEEAQLTALAAELPFYVPTIRVGNACGMDDAVLGCFFNSGEILITPLALQKDAGNGCLTLSVIAHETRHYQQADDPEFKHQPVHVLENDANEFMRNNVLPRCK